LGVMIEWRRDGRKEILQKEGKPLSSIKFDCHSILYIESTKSTLPYHDVIHCTLNTLALENPPSFYSDILLTMFHFYFLNVVCVSIFNFKM
jgi:hypothetical protein